MFNKIVNEVVASVAKVHMLHPDKLKLRSRKREIINARFQAIALVKAYTGLSLSSIGSKFGKLDHSTVLHALAKHKNYIEVDKQYRVSFMEAKAIIMPIIKTNIPTDLESVNKRIEDIKKILYSPEALDSEYFRPYKEELNILLELQECLLLNKHILNYEERLKNLSKTNQIIS